MAEIKFFSRDWTSYPMELLEITMGLLEKDPNERFDLEMLYYHPWMITDEISKNIQLNEKD